MAQTNEATESSDVQLAPGVVINPARRGGRPTVAGTRITVDDIISRLAAGWSIDDLLHAFPHLTREQALQVISYAAIVISRGPWPEISETEASTEWETEDGQWTSERLK